jgi:hypothetical protein
MKLRFVVAIETKNREIVGEVVVVVLVDMVDLHSLSGLVADAARAM